MKLNGRFQKILRGGIKNKLVLDRIESALFLSTFTGRCLNCRKFGHKSVDCPEKNYKIIIKTTKKEHKKKGSFNGKCFHCGKWGHPKSQCWDLQKNLEKDSANSVDDLLLMGVDHDDIASKFCNSYWHRSESYSSLNKELSIEEDSDMDYLFLEEKKCKKVELLEPKREKKISKKVEV